MHSENMTLGVGGLGGRQIEAWWLMFTSVHCSRRKMILEVQLA